MSTQRNAHLTSLRIGTDPEGWRSAGFNVLELKQEPPTCFINDVPLKFHNESAQRGIYAIGTRNINRVIDGLEFFVDLPNTEKNLGYSSHPNFVSRIDHIVVTTPDCDRTTKALEETGIELRRVRPFGVGDREMRQTFFWLGDVILELVGPDIKSGDEPAEIWGLALISEQIEKTVEFLGDFTTPLKPAVQPGRHITTIKTKIFGIDDALAVMTPHSRNR